MFSKLTLFFLFFIFCSCNSVNTQTKSEIIQNMEGNKDVSQPETKIISEPLNDLNQFPDNLRAVWQKFTADGKYRLAQPAEINVSKSARPYVYIWGDLNYQKRIEDEHLAAIVVDTSKNDQNKFSLIIFSPVKNKKDEYDINWLYRDVYLSKTTVNRASGEFYIEKFSDDGTRKACSVNWNKKLKKFECN